MVRSDRVAISAIWGLATDSSAKRASLSTTTARFMGTRNVVDVAPSSTRRTWAVEGRGVVTITAQPRRTAQIWRIMLIVILPL